MRTTLTAFLALLLLPSLALGDGCMMPKLVAESQSQKMVASHRQEALLAVDGESITVTLRTHFRAGPKELAWIVPVPAKPDKVEQARDSVFTTLEQHTAPRFAFYEPPSGGHLKCGCAAMAPNVGHMPAAPAVVVVATGTAGIFQYVILSATKADELSKWLTDNQYFVPVGAERVFDRYVREKWHWLAMRVRPEETRKADLAPHPIRYTYRSDRLVYPLVISQLSADLENEVIVYVMGGSRYACSNWGNASIDKLIDGGKKLRMDPNSPSRTNYEKLFRQAAEQRQGNLFMTEFAFGIDAPFFEPATKDLIGREAPGQQRPYLTRLRAIMPPKAMRHDVSLVPMADWPNVSNQYQMQVERGTAKAGVPTALAAGALGMLCTGLWPRRRTKAGKIGVSALAAVGWAILAMV